MDEADDGCLLTGFEGACVFSAKQTNATAQINVKKKIQEAAKNQELHKVFPLLRNTFELKLKPNKSKHAKALHTIFNSK